VLSRHAERRALLLTICEQLFVALPRGRRVFLVGTMPCIVIESA